MELLTVALLIVLLFFLSVVESSISRLSRLSLRVLAERKKGPKVGLLEKIASDRNQFLLPLQFGSQVLIVVLAVLVTTVLFSSGMAYSALMAPVVTVALIALFRELLPRMITQSDPEEVLLHLLPPFRKFYQLLQWVSAPLIGLLRVFKAARDSNREKVEADEEASEEEIQAYLDVGEEEGIIEEDETELIQSALEFGDTLVREIMTPRTEIAAIEEKATIAQLKDLMVESKFSRIPVYRENIDQIIGVVYVRNLLGHLGNGNGDSPITPLLSTVCFFPETKKVSELLKEMQRSAENLAVIVNEYGAVSGLVTIEDLLEEIVGEIRDEDEQERVDLIHESGDSYIVRGGTDIEDLEEALEIDLGDQDVTTVSGFVVGYLGKVPSAGETVMLAGLSFEILNSDQKKIQSLRVRKLKRASPSN